MKYIKVWAALIIIFSIIVTPAYAGDGSLTIKGGKGGITIKPGNFPNLSGDLEDNFEEQVEEVVLNKAKNIAQIITAICALTCFTVLLVNITRLSTSGPNPHARHQALMSILWSGIALAFFGGSFVVVSFFWNFLQPV